LQETSALWRRQSDITVIYGTDLAVLPTRGLMLLFSACHPEPQAKDLLKNRFAARSFRLKPSG